MSGTNYMTIWEICRSPVTFLADRTTRSVIGYWHDNVVCLSVCPRMYSYKTASSLVFYFYQSHNKKCIAVCYRPITIRSSVFSTAGLHPKYMA